jgi:hypothetical protein
MLAAAAAAHDDDHHGMMIVGLGIWSDALKTSGSAAQCSGSAGGRRTAAAQPSSEKPELERPWLVPCCDVRIAIDFSRRANGQTPEDT